VVTLLTVSPSMSQAPPEPPALSSQLIARLSGPGSKSEPKSCPSKPASRQTCKVPPLNGFSTG